ncbi:hypothetical protein AB0D04_18060 [Streptomyces sp. NPDC048483]|uniref:hypothetical protein n=1 Tax=Streptomyces sp. NPDC048483 TaxID=3154927 RepID=UPI00341A4CD1
MNDRFDLAVAEPKPLFWYGLPHGYQQLDLDPSPEGLDAVAQQIRELPEEFRDRADQVFRLYAVVLMKMRKHEVLGCALGVHPDDSGDAAMSVITVSSLPMPGVNPKAVLTKMLADSAGTGRDEGIRPVELPIGTGFLVESERKTVAPGVPPEGQDEPLEGTVWQGLVAVPDTASSSVITVQLVTGAVELADDYREVLLGTARTLSFTDPDAVEAESASGAGQGSTETVRSVFG